MYVPEIYPADILFENLTITVSHLSHLTVIPGKMSRMGDICTVLYSITVILFGLTDGWGYFYSIKFNLFEWIAQCPRSHEKFAKTLWEEMQMPQKNLAFLKILRK
jgi:hypothetical protein